MADRAYRAAGGREEGDRRRREGRLSGGEVARLRHQDDPRDRAPQEDGKPCSPGSGGAAGDLQGGAGAGVMARHCERSFVAALLAMTPETAGGRSGERRGGKGGGSTCRLRWWPETYKKNITKNKQ